MSQLPPTGAGHSDALAARRALLDALGPMQDYEAADIARRRLHTMPSDDRRPLVPLRIGIIGNATLDFFAHALEPFLVRDGFAPAIYLAGFAQVEQELLDAGSGLACHRPAIVVVAHDHHFLEFPADRRSTWSFAEAESWAAGEARRLLAPVETFCRRQATQAVLFTPAAPRISAWGAIAGTSPWGEIFLVREVNRALMRFASPLVRLLDVERIAADFGKRFWEDERYWHLARQPWTLDACVPIAHHTSRLIAGMNGKACKVIAVDPDNTLWGGVLGDKGPEHLAIGGDPVGDSHVAFQIYLAALRRRGILLVMLSRYDANTLRSALELEEMRLRFDDFTIRGGDFLSKAENLSAIATELGIGLDAFCLVDADAAERAAIREALPEVRVVELPEDPALYARTLDDRA